MVVDPDWGDHCGDSWRRHVLAETGFDVCDVLGPMPRRPRELAAMMRSLGVRDLSGVVTAAMGPSIPRRQARRGDVVRKGWALGYCVGPRALFLGGWEAMSLVDEVWSLNRMSSSS